MGWEHRERTAGSRGLSQLGDERMIGRQVKRRRRNQGIRRSREYADEKKLEIEVLVRLQRVLSSRMNSFTMIQMRKTVNKGIQKEE